MLDFAGICRGRTPSALNLIILVPTRIALFRSVGDEFRGYFYPSEIKSHRYFPVFRPFFSETKNNGLIFAAYLQGFGALFDFF